MAATRTRLLELFKTQSQLFSATFNPERLRLGNRVIRQRMRGPTLAAYYPKRSVTLRDLQDRFKEHDLETFDEAQVERLDALELLRTRGKGAPKKKRTAAESKSAKKKK